MSYVLVRHKVADFGRWKAVYDSHIETRKTAGLKDLHLLRNVQDRNEVFLLFEASDLKKAQEFGASADLKDTMAKAGVIEKPHITFFD